ncbi:uncharacterized protein K460DRAFT_401901 [Cucurbitaria berberidis CBS 394.84]|uniref:Uncharacterized protein n=1 Tax=Cucurbitaria berberidis CBS 394.84 TaxID=1168544 RepID=A0A9P4LDI0_9PLEO|nr:uncharacterized protein K460DRAFT_401901 [Cucurbitaria berberidis CBS 394.84]KAF1851901.1 hypothetical protein K460DRAFT_401901 [Cucurbitaria berberidis CBS 394.84]
MKQTYYVSMGPMGYISQEKSEMTVWRGHAQFSMKVKIARVRNTPFGRELSRQMVLCRVCPFGRNESLDPIDMVYQHCLLLLRRLAPQTSLQDLSLECFLHSPTDHLELVDADNAEDIRIEGEHEVVYTPSFSMSPMRTADLPESCKAIRHIQACRTCIMPTNDEGQSLTSVQGKIMTGEGVLMYFKPRIDFREPEFEHELRIMSRIDEAGLRARIKVPRLHGIVVSGENGETTIGLLMTMITSSGMGPTWKAQASRARLRYTKIGNSKSLPPYRSCMPMGAGALKILLDDERRETVEGDEQGLTRLFQEWLPSHAQPHEEGPYTTWTQRMAQLSE